MLAVPKMMYIALLQLAHGARHCDSVILGIPASMIKIHQAGKHVTFTGSLALCDGLGTRLTWQVGPSLIPRLFSFFFL